MKEKIKVTITIFFLLLSFSNIYSSDIVDKKYNSYAGKWEIFTDMKDVVAVTESRNSNIVFCASLGGLYTVDVSNGKIINKFTTLNGLISNELTAITTDTLNRVWIGASDGSITIYDIATGKFSYIYDIKNSNESNKSINGFAINSSFIFVATSYGIQKISFLNFNFVDAPYYQLGTYSTKTKVNALTATDNQLFAATASGIAYAPLNGNLNNPSTWINYNINPFDVNVTAIDKFDNKIFAASSKGMWYFQNGWFPYPNPLVATASIKAIKGIGDKLYFVTTAQILFSDKNNLSLFEQYYVNGNYTTINGDNNNKPLVGVSGYGVLAEVNGQVNAYFPNGPNKNLFTYLAEDTDGTLWVAGGSGTSGIYKFDGKLWTSYNTGNQPLIGASNDFRMIQARNGVVWSVAFGGGATMINGTTIKNYNTNNSNLPGTQQYPDFCVPTGCVYDNYGVMWVAMYETNSQRSLYAFRGDSNFTGIFNKSSDPNYGRMAVDGYNTKWICGIINNPGLYYFNENGTIDTTYDDVYERYASSEYFGSADVTDVTVDKNNEVWIATSNGVFFISNPLLAIRDPQNKPIPQKLQIISGGLKVPFTENCISIASDVLNQKWVGTVSNGVFHFSDDGTTLIEQFNTSNSPIADNKISTIFVSPNSGKAYFGTLKGLSALQTNSIKPVEEFDKVICAPNPYLIPSNVKLRIDGLVDASSIKIITLSGEVVAEFDSPGGRVAEWNGLDKKGNLVPSGIYIVVGFNKDASKVGKGKVAIVRR